MKNIFNFPQHYKNVKAFHSKYERFLMPTFLVAGFVFDYIVFANIEISLNFIFLMVKCYRLNFIDVCWKSAKAISLIQFFKKVNKTFRLIRLNLVY